MKDVTVGIKAFLRIAEFDTCLSSLHGRGFHQVIVADDSGSDEAREQLYRRHETDLPLRVLHLPFRSGLSAGRNQLVNACETPYFLLMDDDMELLHDIQPLRLSLDSDAQLGGVGSFREENGRVIAGDTNIHLFSDRVVLDCSPGPSAKCRMSDGTSFCYFDKIDNFTLFKTAVFADSAWDETYIIGREHIDFYLQHKHLRKWRFGVLEKCLIRHASARPEQRNYRYQQFRHDPTILQAMDQYFRHKWNLPVGIVYGLPHKPGRFSLYENFVHLQMKTNRWIPWYR